MLKLVRVSCKSAQDTMENCSIFCFWLLDFFPQLLKLSKNCCLLIKAIISYWEHLGYSQRCEALFLLIELPKCICQRLYQQRKGSGNDMLHEFRNDRVHWTFRYHESGLEITLVHNGILGVHWSTCNMFCQQNAMEGWDIMGWRVDMESWELYQLLYGVILLCSSGKVIWQEAMCAHRN